MKRLMFLFVSAILAGASYASNLSKDIIAMVSDPTEESIIKQQQQSLILEQPVSFQNELNGHYSHSSHRSHSSHSSHSSHRSHYSSKFA